MQRFTATLERGLDPDQYQVRVIRPAVHLGAWHPAGTTRQKWLGYIDKFLLFPQSQTFKAALAWADLVHIIDQANAVYHLAIHSKPHLITCHDLIAIESSLGNYPENPVPFTGKIYQRWILNSLKKFSYITSVSHFTKSRLVEILGLPESTITVIHNGLNYPYQILSNRAELLRKYSDLIPFVLHVGGNQWYKNRLGVLKVFARLHWRVPELKLVMVGKPFTEPMKQYIRDCQLEKVIISRVSIANQELEELYNCATAFLFPSLVEGFGWPIVEAQSCGCPVVCSSAPPLPEVAGEAALMAAPEDHQSLADHLYDLIHNSGLRQELITKGLHNISRFSTESMIRNFDKIYQQVLSAPRLNQNL